MKLKSLGVVLVLIMAIAISITLSRTEVTPVAEAAVTDCDSIRSSGAAYEETVYQQCINFGNYTAAQCTDQAHYAYTSYCIAAGCNPFGN